MIQHIYDPHGTSYLSSPVTDLMHHVNVFAAADKYDVPSLRIPVVSRFAQLLLQKWVDKQEFCTIIQHLCGPNAVSFADTSLQRSAAAFCSGHISSLVKLDAFVSMLEECGPFAARLLTTFLKDKTFVHTFRCQECISASARRFPRPSGVKKCFTCGSSESIGQLGGTGTHKRYSIMEL
jgi:hypothetical protein